MLFAVLSASVTSFMLVSVEVKCLLQIGRISMSVKKYKSQTRGVGMMTRRELMRMLAIAGVGSSVSNPTRLLGLEGDNSWVKYMGNPVLGGQY